MTCNNTFKKAIFFASTSPLGTKKYQKWGRIGLNALQGLFFSPQITDPDAPKERVAKTYGAHCKTKKNAQTLP